MVLVAVAINANLLKIICPFQALKGELFKRRAINKEKARHPYIIISI